jgi:hypothetical protein
MLHQARLEICENAHVRPLGGAGATSATWKGCVYITEDAGIVGIPYLGVPGSSAELFCGRIRGIGPVGWLRRKCSRVVSSRRGVTHVRLARTDSIGMAMSSRQNTVCAPRQAPGNGARRRTSTSERQRAVCDSGLRLDRSNCPCPEALRHFPRSRGVLTGQGRETLFSGNIFSHKSVWVSGAAACS